MARIVVVGAGIAGLGAALALGRRSHEVLLLEGDSASPPARAEDAWDAWPRPGTPQARQLHVFLARARNLLLKRAPDVRQALFMAGADELDLVRHGPGEVPHLDDNELVLIRCRRPIFESVLRQAVEREPHVQIRAGVTVDGLLTATDRRSGRPRVAGVHTRDGQQFSADMVVLASGRSTPIASWLAAAGMPHMPLEASEATGILYYSRYFVLKSGAQPPAATHAGISGDLGYASYGVGRADNQTFVVYMMIPVWDRELRVMHQEAAFMAAARSIPAVATWLEPDRALPIGRVESMGQLRNLTRRFVVDGVPIAPGLHVIGDVLCHTNPMLGWGSSLALSQAFALADVLDAEPDDLYAQALALDARIGAEAQECYRVAVEMDRSRTSEWRGESTGVPLPEDDWPRFMRLVLTPAAATDATIWQALTRFRQLLDPPAVLWQNQDLLTRARQVASVPGKPPAVSRAELLQAVTAAAESTTGDRNNQL